MSINITDAIFARAEIQPEVPAIVAPRLSISYRALCHGVRRAAQRFHETGWKTGDIVGISLRNHPVLHLVSSLALARMSITQASISVSDPKPLRLKRIQRLGINGLVASNARDACGVTPCIAHPEWLTQIADATTPGDIRESGGDRLWILNETSGTTATPKVTGVSHWTEDIHRMRVTPIFGHLPGERFLNLTGMRFLTALKRAICCLSDGGTITLAPTNLSLAQLPDWITAHGVAYVSCVPMHLHQLLRAVQSDTPALPSVRILRSSSAALPESAVREAQKRLTPNLYTNYGANEAGPMVAATPAMLEANPTTVGLPLAGVELQLVDKDRPVSIGVMGHVRVRGPGIEPSYVHTTEPGQTHAFRDGWFFPGDVGVITADGLLFLKGRSDDVMNFDGIMVGPTEIESTLRQHPAVKDVAAFALPSPDH
jgi:acyl-coenzyme A synthetase/AMP-(fatty) acid ligase